eukprot:348020-Pleurochrysis_carterae.AAC.1
MKNLPRSDVYAKPTSTASHAFTAPKCASFRAYTTPLRASSVVHNAAASGGGGAYVIGQPPRELHLGLGGEEPRQARSERVEGTCRRAAEAEALETDLTATSDGGGGGWTLSLSPSPSPSLSPSPSQA